MRKFDIVGTDLHSRASNAKDDTDARTQRRHLGIGSGAPDPTNWPAAIIEGSDDSIVGIRLDGSIQSWNKGATRLFGYRADEMIGKSVAILIPNDRLEQELAMPARIRRGRYVGCIETKRRRKDGSLVDVSLITSLIRNDDGVVVGIATVARDITEKLTAQEQQQILMGEMRHRIKNLFALAAAIVSISAKSYGIDGGVIDDIRARLWSLARAHELTMADAVARCRE